MRSVVPIVTLVLGIALGVIGATSRSAGWFADTAVAPEAAAGTTVAGIAPGSAQILRCPDEAQLRLVIREELAAAAGSPGTVTGSHTADTGPMATEPSDAQGRVELVNRQVDYYIRAGAISQSDMAALQEEIAKLDPASQRAAVGKLVRAINSGALDGNL